MHVHSCTPSVSMHIETVSLTQNISSIRSLLKGDGFLKKCSSQAEKGCQQPIRRPWFITKLQLLCIGTRWLTRQSPNYQHLDKGLLLFVLFGYGNRKVSPQSRRAAWHMDRAREASLHSMTRVQNCRVGVQSSCHVGI